MDEIVKTVEKFTGIPVHPRQPYAGRYAFTAFSGGHQDGIRKGLASQKKVKNKHWLVPYLPIDPEDVGRTYEELIRINGQSGKAGIASAVEGIFGLELPRELQVEFGKTVQAYADNKGGEVNADILRLLFEKEYLTPCEKFRYVGHQLCSRHRDAPQGIKIDLKVEGKSVSVYGEGNGPIDAAVKAFNFPLDVVSYGEHSIGKGSGAKAASYVHLSLNGSGKECHGVGIHENSTTASVMAVVGGIGRAIKQGKIEATENFGKTERPKPLSKGFGAGAYEKPKI
jgi:2-isopropylmalate synthase